MFNKKRGGGFDDVKVAFGYICNDMSNYRTTVGLHNQEKIMYCKCGYYFI